MPNIFHQSIEDILRAATPEQRLLWNHIFLRFGERVSISQYYYRGSASAGNELLTYSANKMYLAYDLKFGAVTTGSLTLNPVVLYDENNATFLQLRNNVVYWDATAAIEKFVANHIEIKNVLFSRYLNSINYVSMQFIGYRIGI